MNDTDQIPDAEIVKHNPALAVGRPAEPEQQRTASSQARVDAVAELVKTAMAKAGTLTLTPEESKALLADFADSDFQPGAGGKEHLLYIEHAALRDRFNTVLGLGQWALIVRETWNENFETRGSSGKPPQKGVRVYSRAMMLIRGCYVGEAVGDMDYYPGNAAQNYGDAFEGAKTAAFRRCAKEFGVGLQAWRKGFADGWRDRKYARLEHEQLRRQPISPAEAGADRNESKPKGNGDESAKSATGKDAKAGAGQPAPANGAPHAERLKMFITWLYEHCGAEIAGWAIPYLRSHTPDGGEASSALMPNEDLTGLSENSLAAIRKDMAGFLERLKAFAEANSQQIPGAEVGEKQITGIVSEVTVKEGTTKGKPWTVYNINMPAGLASFSTFSKSVGEAAKAAKGQSVTIFYIFDDKGNTATAIKVGDKLTRAGESKEK